MDQRGAEFTAAKREIAVPVRREMKADLFTGYVA